MRSVVSALEMKKIDSYTIQEIGIPSLVLMERAAASVAFNISRQMDCRTKVLCVCGDGNNGGDGVAVARILYGMGYEAAFYMAGNPEKWTEEVKKQIQIARNAGVPEYNELDMHSAEIVVDGIFGIGLSRNVEGSYALVIEKINQWRREKESRKIWSLDIPSGICSDTGQVRGCSIQADVTVTFGFLKRGQILYPGRDFAGKIFVEDIGFPQKALKVNAAAGFTANVQDFEQLPERKNDSNKGTYGKILVIAGSRNMSGAAFFAGSGVCRSGAGLVRILTEAANREILQMRLPEAMLSLWEDMEAETLKEVLNWADVIVLGPGIGQTVLMEERIARVLEYSKVPMVIDADGLNFLARHPEWYRWIRGRAVLTPHMGEMSRLTGQSVDTLKTDRAGHCYTFAGEHDVICVLKDSSTVVSDGQMVYLNQTGNSGMATGGSGDVLAGVIGGLAAGTDLFRASWLGVWIHGMAGDLAAEKGKGRSMIASDMIDSLQMVFASAEKTD